MDGSGLVVSHSTQVSIASFGSIVFSRDCVLKRRDDRGPHRLRDKRADLGGVPEVLGRTRENHPDLGLRGRRQAAGYSRLSVIEMHAYDREREGSGFFQGVIGSTGFDTIRCQS